MKKFWKVFQYLSPETDEDGREQWLFISLALEYMLDELATRELDN